MGGIKVYDKRRKGGIKVYDKRRKVGLRYMIREGRVEGLRYCKRRKGVLR